MSKTILYKKKIIKELYFAHNLSCSDIGSRIHTSIPLVTRMLNELIEEGVIVETGYAPSTGGRRPLTSLRSTGRGSAASSARRTPTP